MPAESASAAVWFTPGFNQGKLDQYILSVLANRDGQVFVISNEKGHPQGIVRLQNIGVQMQSADPAGLRMRLESSGLPLGRYGRSCLFLRGESYSIIPKDLAEAADDEIILSLRHSLRKGEKLASYQEDGLASYFIARPALSSFLKEYSQACTVSTYGMMVAREAERLSAGKENVLLADLGSRSLDIAVAGEKGLTFINAFPVRTAEDAAYHFLNVWRRLEKPFRVWLTGEFVPQSRATGLIGPYIDGLNYIRAEKSLPEKDVPGGIHDLQLLLNHLPCVS